jgi:hypothetical protein
MAENYLRPLPDVKGDEVFIDFLRDNVMDQESFDHIGHFILSTVSAAESAAGPSGRIDAEIGLQKQEGYQLTIEGVTETVNGYFVSVNVPYGTGKNQQWHHHYFFLIANAYNFIDRVMSTTPQKNA